MSENIASGAFWVVIPDSVLSDDNIPANAKLLYGRISALTTRAGYCWASNAQLAEASKMSPDSVSRLVSVLQKAGHIRLELDNDMDRGSTIRRIYQTLPAPTPLGKNAETPLGNFADTPLGKKTEPPSAKKPSPPLQNCRPLHYSKKNIKEKEISARENRAQIDSYFAEVFAKFPEVLSALTLMLDARAEAGNPMPSLTAAKTLHRKLMQVADDGEGFNPYLAESCLLYSAEKGYPSVYPPKSDEVAAARERLRRSAASAVPESDTAVDLGGLVFV